MAAAYHFKAVAGDGKIRTGILHSDNEKAVARELRAQGLAPVYIGLQRQKRSLELKLPVLARGTRRDV
ncbi:MAG: hypothetical protein NT090_05960, partial [Acidobacteria bacterium]|nr:hypothetical protein [Acidobacteriota bacterium]